MKVINKMITFQSQGEIDIIDLTAKLETLIDDNGINQGILSANVIGSTAALTCIEYEPLVVSDFKELLKKLVPKGAGYEHDQIDSNAHSHLRSSLIGSSVSITIENGRLQLGTWQQIVFICLDTRPRARKVSVTLIGV